MAGAGAFAPQCTTAMGKTFEVVHFCVIEDFSSLMAPQGTLQNMSSHVLFHAEAF